jgi:hypothetical protein
MFLRRHNRRRTGAQGVPLIKCMSTLKRRADVSPQKFKAERFDVHSFPVKRLPEVKDYTQNRSSTDRIRAVSPRHTKICRSTASSSSGSRTRTLNAGFVLDAGKTLMTHATEFVAKIPTFLWSKRTKSFELLPGRQCAARR